MKRYTSYNADHNQQSLVIEHPYIAAQMRLNKKTFIAEIIASLLSYSSLISLPMILLG